MKYLTKLKDLDEAQPKGCKHPLSYLHSSDVRHYCPDCGRFLLDAEVPVKVEAQEQTVEGIKIREEVHTRCKFAQNEYNRLIAQASKSGSNISGFNAYKINQAYRIWIHYRNEYLAGLPPHKAVRPTLRRLNR